MIGPDPECPHCRGTGLAKRKGLDIGLLPCNCRMEVNNCDRCSTLCCGEHRAPSCRWKESLGVLCDTCRRDLYPPVVEILRTSEKGESLVVRGSPEGLTRLKDAIKQALGGHPTQVTVRGENGEEVSLIVHLM